jgi:gamma-glutamyl:cysteine ligase YbdK (ATP-grasp superfamily)
MSSRPLHLFDAFGIELEYMIVDAASLDVRPISDRVLVDDTGAVVSDVEQGPISWSNELTHHVIELKTTSPAASLTALADQFQQNVRQINDRLRTEKARLLPTAVHPWMNPAEEMRLWPHDFHAVYEAFDKVFDCRGHGWANLQSMHINLPFANDEEFGRLHAAIRLLLPILPALAASSPILDGRPTGLLDSRLDVYRRNSARIPEIAGRVIPEPVYDQARYDEHIFQPMYRAIAPYDSQGVLQDEFLNARGAIARFSRGAIEIRVIDVQECPQTDLAIATLTIAALRQLVAQRWTSTQEQQQVSIDTLEPLLLAAIRDADAAVIRDADYLRHFGVSANSISLRDLWRRVRDAAALSVPDAGNVRDALDVLLSEGPLARRILQAVGTGPSPAKLKAVYERLADCLERGELFHADQRG